MTTIAYKSGILVGDSLLCYDNGAYCYRAGITNKVQVNKAKTVYYAESGDCQENGLFFAALEAFKDGYKYVDPAPEDETSLIAAVIEGSKYGVYHVYGNCTPVLKNHLAEGTGKLFAMGVMEHGGSAIDGVAAAIELDVYSGYPIHGYNLQTGEEIRIENKEDYTRYRNRHKLSKSGVRVDQPGNEVPKLGSENDPPISVGQDIRAA